MKKTVILTLIISAIFLASCSGGSEKKETPKTTNTSVSNTVVSPQSNLQNTANTTVKNGDNEADDVRPTNSAKTNSSVKIDMDDLKSKDTDSVRKSNSNIKDKGKDDLNKKRDFDDIGKRNKDDDDGDN